MSLITVAPTCLTDIARLDPRSSSLHAEAASQVIVLDYFRLGGPLEDHLAFCRNGIWVRHSTLFTNGTRAVIHLVLPDLVASIAVEGTVAGCRMDARGRPWLLLWFNGPQSEEYLLLLAFMREPRPATERPPQRVLPGY